MNPFEHLDITGIIILLAIPIIIFIWRILKKQKEAAKVDEHLRVMQAKTDYEKAKGKERKSILGTGEFKCLAIRPGNIADWTTIPKPIGELYMSDPTCPVSGGVYIVKEKETGEVIDYDPRKETVDVQKTPEWAWYATHWGIVPRVFSIPLSMWKSPATWFAAATLVILFITVMATVGG